MNVNLTPNITGKNVNIIKGATQADLTNSVNNSKIYRDEAEAFSIVSEAKSVEASYSALNASISSTTASDKATIATTKANEASNSAINASASEAVCIAKATITTDKANIATAQSVIATDKANEASVSANTATTQAGIATTKASEASTSASNALTSENNADTSEANALIYRNQAESFANSINPSNLVHISGTETITGNKTFSGTVSGLTKATVGLGNVDNTSDINKPISTATQNALNTKVDTTGDQTIAGVKTFSSTIAGSISGNAATATNASTLNGYSGAHYLLQDSWDNNPGKDANLQEDMKVDFTYGYNAPLVGPLMNVGVNNYSMQFNGSYRGATNLAYRTKNGDNNTWNPWRYIAFTDSNITGNAATATTATTLQTARTINGVSFNGSANITIPGATGAGSDKIFFENGQTITTSYSITSGMNAMTAGPITINNGVTITIPDGSSWTIV